jgi:hypothetical protein
MYRQTLDPARAPGPYLDPSLFLFQSGRMVGHYPPGIDHEAATSLRGGECWANTVMYMYSGTRAGDGRHWRRPPKNKGRRRGQRGRYDDGEGPVETLVEGG